MIKEICIRNFKIFKGLHKFTLSTATAAPVTVISTITASGKTTFIDAVYWCLYGKTPMKNDSIFNREREQELMAGEIETVDVELMFFEGVNPSRAFRSIAFQKIGGKLVRCPEYDNCTVENCTFLPKEVIAQTIFLSESLHPLHIPFLHNSISKIGRAHSKRHQIQNYDKFEALCNELMSRIASSATQVFNELYSRQGNYNIAWDGSFSLLRTDQSNFTISDLSDTDQLVFNISILHGARDVLYEHRNGRATFPVFVDDIFMRADKSQFSLDKLIHTLPGRQVVILAHENSLLNETLSKYCGEFYSIRRNSDWTNVEIDQVAVNQHILTVP